jgi:hypothetical protein
MAALIACGVVAAEAQQLLDRVVARVGNSAITETDVRAAVGFGVVELPAGADPLAAGTRALIDRRLILLEVLRFPAAPPSDEAVADVVAKMKAHAGPQYAALSQSTGVGDERLREIARDTLRIRSYVEQRFGATVQAGLQDARDYYEKHPEEFTRDGTRLPFEQVESAARAAASAERRRATIEQWVAGLRARGHVVEVPRS